MRLKAQEKNNLNEIKTRKIISMRLKARGI